MIYIDKFGHLVTEENNSEFNIFKRIVGITDDQYIQCKLPYYELTHEQSSNAVIYGARYVDETTLYSIIRNKMMTLESLGSANEIEVALAN